MVYGQKTLLDYNTISDYQIVCKAELRVTVRTRGGGSGPSLTSFYYCNLEPQCHKKLLLFQSKKTELRKMINAREDAWSVVCEAFSVCSDVKEKIQDNSDDPYIRFLDAIHWMYHHNPDCHQLTWHDIKGKVETLDRNFTEVIVQSGLL